MIDAVGAETQQFPKSSTAFHQKRSSLSTACDVDIELHVMRGRRLRATSDSVAARPLSDVRRANRRRNYVSGSRE